MLKLLILIVLSVLSAIAIAAPPRDVEYSISVENFGDMYIQKKNCSPKRNSIDNEGNFVTSLFGSEFVLKERLYLLAVMQENNLDLSMMLQTDSQVLAFASTHRYKDGLISFDSLFSFSHNFKGDSSVIAPLIFGEGKNTVYYANQGHEGFFVETVAANGERISKYFGKLSDNSGGYFRVLFKPAVDCNFLISSPDNNNK